MKIGVALSGCDIGGAGALMVLNWLDSQGMHIHMLSSSGTASVPALLFAGCDDTYQRQCCLDQFVENWRQTGLDAAVAGLSAYLEPMDMERIRGLSVNAMSIADGRAVSFTNDYSFQTSTLATFPLSEVYDALTASLGSAGDAGGCPCQGLRLSDYSLQYGCPLFPLHLSGCDRILSFAFIPQHPQTSCDIFFRKSIEQTLSGADLHLSIPSLPDWNPDFAIPILENCRNRLFHTIAFGT